MQSGNVDGERSELQALGDDRAESGELFVHGTGDGVKTECGEKGKARSEDWREGFVVERAIGQDERVQIGAGGDERDDVARAVAAADCESFEIGKMERGQSANAWSILEEV